MEPSHPRSGPHSRRQSEDLLEAVRGVGVRAKKKARSRANSDDEVRIFSVLFHRISFFIKLLLFTALQYT